MRRIALTQLCALMASESASTRTMVAVVQTPTTRTVANRRKASDRCYPIFAKSPQTTSKKNDPKCYAQYGNGHDDLLVDIVVTGSLNRHLMLKEMKASMRRKIHLLKVSTNEIYEIKQKPTDEAISYAKDQNAPDYIVLNDLPEDVQFNHWTRVTD